MSASEPNPAADEVVADARIAEIVRRALGEAEVCAVVALPAESLNSDGAAKPDGYRSSVRVDVQVGGGVRVKVGAEVGMGAVSVGVGVGPD